MSLLSSIIIISFIPFQDEMSPGSTLFLCEHNMACGAHTEMWNLIRHHNLRRLIWICTDCQIPLYVTLGIDGLTPVHVHMLQQQTKSAVKKNKK